MRRKNTATEFLNVDLDIRANTGDLDDFLRPIKRSVAVLRQTTHEASIEVPESFPSLEETVINLVKLIEALPSRARSIWSQFEFRKLNVGIQAGCEPYAATFSMSAKTVELIASVRLEILFTVYAPIAD